MTTEEMRKEFYALFNMMANSSEVKNMHVFGCVEKEMFEWFVVNKPDLAQEWLDKLESIRWEQYLTAKEAEKILSGMTPKAPWTKEQWKAAMEKSDYPVEKEPYYNYCALFVTMSMIMSDSGETIKEYVGEDKLFAFVYHMAIDKLTDVDKRFSIRSYFGL